MAPGGYDDGSGISPNSGMAHALDGGVGNGQSVKHISDMFLGVVGGCSGVVWVNGVFRVISDDDSEDSSFWPSQSCSATLMTWQNVIGRRGMVMVVVVDGVVSLSLGWCMCPVL